MNSKSFSGADNNEVVSADRYIISTSSPAESSNSQSEMKRVAAKEKIEKYYYQLTDGCGDPLCHNEFCASSNVFLYPGIDRNEAAGKAVEMFKNRSRLCDASNRKLSKVSDQEESSSIKESSPDDTNNSCVLNVPSLDYDAIQKKNELVILTEDKLVSTIEEATRTSDWTPFAVLIFSTFSSPEALTRSFLVENKVNKSTPGKSPFVKGQMAGDLAGLDAVKGFRERACDRKDVGELNTNLRRDYRDIDGSDDDDDDDDDNKMGEGSAVDGPGYQDDDANDLSSVVVYENINSTPVQQSSFLSKLFGSLEENILNVSASNYEVSVDVEALSRCYERLSSLADSSLYCEPMKAALVHLSRKIESGFHSGAEKNNLMSDSRLPNIYAAVLEMPLLDSLELLELAVPNFYRTVRLLPIKCQVELVRHWARRFGGLPNGSAAMRRVVCAIQQMITVRVVMTPWAMLEQTVNDDDAICGAVILLKLFYYASMLGGRMDEKWLEKQEKKGKDGLAGSEAANAKKLAAIETMRFGPNFSMSDEDDDMDADRASSNDSFFHSFIDIPKERQGSSAMHRNPLGEELDLRAVDCREPLLPSKEFVNETLSEAIEMDKDYAYYRVRPEWRFSFMANPFVLTTTSKQMGLYFDNRIRMFDERRATLFQNVLYAGSSTASMTAPYLRLNVRRDHIVGDALVNLETITMNSPHDLKKQLFVEFEGEQGVDEGGVSKEFFQLIVEELFNPDFGMFRLEEETQTFWFNELSFENDAEFTLIGILIGLAIYNNIILDVRFPMVLYRKLLSRRGNFDDLLLARLTLGRSLLSLLNYEGNVEDLLQTFCINTTDVFGNVHTHDLKPGGSDILVTNDNRKEFVELYADFLLNKSVEKQFRAFRRGFRLVTDESPLAQLFNAEELELLICGSDENSDFHALEQSAEYDGGYKKDTPVIRYFWETVHEMGEEQKKKLLQFTTGSDRVPIGGLAKLKLIVARNGQDTDRLPTSHTCFNVLLLPEYNSKEKLKERLLKAITYSKGFGML